MNNRNSYIDLVALAVIGIDSYLAGQISYVQKFGNNQFYSS